MTHSYYLPPMQSVCASYGKKNTHSYILYIYIHKSTNFYKWPSVSPSESKIHWDVRERFSKMHIHAPAVCVTKSTEFGTKRGPWPVRVKSNWAQLSRACFPEAEEDLLQCVRCVRQCFWNRNFEIPNRLGVDFFSGKSGGLDIWRVNF